MPLEVYVHLQVCLCMYMLPCTELWLGHNSWAKYIQALLRATVGVSRLSMQFRSYIAKSLGFRVPENS